MQTRGKSLLETPHTEGAKRIRVLSRREGCDGVFTSFFVFSGMFPRSHKLGLPLLLSLEKGKKQKISSPNKEVQAGTCAKCVGARWKARTGNRGSGLPAGGREAQKMLEEDRAA